MRTKSVIGLLAVVLASLAVISTETFLVSANGRDLCISINGDTKVDKGGAATCDSVASDEGRPNIALASEGAVAIAGTTVGDSGNMAMANGEGTYAVAWYGDGNFAMARGINTYAVADDGDNNQSIALGGDADAASGSGNRNRAIAVGGGSLSIAGFGDDNSSLAVGADSCAVAGGSPSEGRNGVNAAATGSGEVDDQSTVFACS